MIAVAAVVLALAVVGGLAGRKLFDDVDHVRAELESARSDLAAGQAALQADDDAALLASVGAAAAAADRAVSETGDPLWKFGESVPLLGENLHAVRVLAESAQTLTTEVAAPAASLVAEFDLVADPVTGAYDVSVIREARKLSATAQAVLDEVAANLHELDTEATADPVTDAVDEFSSLLDSARATLPSVQPGLAVASMMLGVDAPKTIDLAFMNSAEASGLGGGPSAQILVSADQGRISILQQPASTDFRNTVDLAIPVDESVRQLYDSILTDNINASTSRPDLPYSAGIIDAWWQRDMGAKLDGIVLADPMALAAILAVTGPVTLPDGTTLDATNAVPILLNEAYSRYPEPEAQDAFFKAAAASVFQRLLEGGFELRPMFDAIAGAVDGGHLMLWSADPAVQSALDGSRLQGTLPTGNAEATVLGVYFRDRSSSKGDFYLHTDATVTTNSCDPQAPTYTVDVSLRRDVPADAPEIAYSQLYDFWRTEVFVYGPVGGSAASTAVTAPALDTVVDPTVADLGRPVVKFTVDADNGQEAAVSATFVGVPGTYGPTELRTTPMINATTVTMVEADCG
ncbi:hypothetical protein J2X63_000484 [Agromyces sp. 3263]|uniref:DUF4012 domain-containing protein n=1 Tax=Agromyces sp. 3263 TaxID=2817750 RepID=UPI00285DA998|nr:DUF4012 domain-containing protein [Agromyces sp. 3263]MDR6904798.1 hypothetical protein [Agromyces sp. 3263]